MKKNTYQISEVARLLGVRYYRIEYAHRTQALDEPPRVNNVRTYFAEDVRRAADYFVVPLPDEVRDQIGTNVRTDAPADPGEEAEDGL